MLDNSYCQQSHLKQDMFPSKYVRTVNVFYLEDCRATIHVCCKGDLGA